MANKLFHITAITNLHVGSGKENIGVVDNLIQRDVVTNLPVINSSSLKGALREHCNGKDFVEFVFGSEPGGTNVNKRETNPGNYKFFDAHLLAIPARSDKSPYYMVTCPMVINHYNETAKMFGINVEISIQNDVSINKNGGGIYIEDFEYSELKKTSEDIKKLIGSDVDVVVLSDKDFIELCDDEHLPVISRNQLENGKSGNLWYEQVLPRFSVLYFPLIAAENFDVFKNAVTNTLVQIGANATIGYGFCKIEDKTLSNSNT